MNRKWPEYQVGAAGGLVTTLAIVVLVGWATHTQALVRLTASSPEIRRNTALGLLVCGLGMISLARRRRTPALLAGAFCALLGFLTAAEFAGGANLGIDDLLGKSYFADQPFPAGRMSAISTGCFMLAGSAIFSWHWMAGRRFRSWVTAILASMLAAIGSVSSVGHFFGNTNAYAWADFTRIAFYSAVAFALIGVSLLIFTWGEERQTELAALALRELRFPEWLPLTAGIGVLTATLGLWQALIVKGPEVQPLLPEIALASGVVLALVVALGIHLLQRGKGTPESTMLAGFGLAFATLVAVGIVQHQSIKVLVETDKWVARTQAILTEMEATYSNLQRAESGTRGYVATGQDEYLRLQRDGEADSGDHFQTLRNLIPDAGQQGNLSRLTSLIHNKKQVMEELVALRRDQGFAAARQELSKGEGLRLMYEIQASVEFMKTGESRLLETRQAASRASARKSNTAVALGTLLALTFVLASGWITHRDLTEQRRSEQALQASEAAFRTLANAMPQVVWICTPDGLNVYFNDRWVEYTGLSREESYGHGWNKPFHPGDKQPAWDALNHAMATGEVYRIESRLRAADGSYRWFLIRGVPLLDASGGITKWIGTGTEIDELKRVEQELALNRARLTLALRAGRSGTFDWDIQNNVNVWSSEIEALYGLEQGKFGGTNEDWESSLLAEDLEPARAGIQEALKSGEFKGEWRIRRRSDGEIRWLGARAKVFFDGASRPARMIGINTDITEQKRAEAELKELNASLERRVSERTAELTVANQEMEAFAYSVAHDLRSPLRGIDGFSLALVEDYGSKLNGEAQEYLRRIRAAAQRMGQLIDDLLNLSRISRVEISQEKVDLSARARAFVSDLQRLEPERAVEFVIPPSLEVMGDARLLRVVLENLLGNAWKFSAYQKPARIELALADSGRRKTYFVRDNGVGFDMNYVGKLFAPFQRLHGFAEFPGTGIGLVTVARIVRKHGGEVWAEGAVGQGATFYFTLGE